MVLASPPNGGAGLAGKSGRKTANVCDTTAMETKMNTAAHFMFAALSKIKQHGKQKFLPMTVIRSKSNVTRDSSKRSRRPKEFFNVVTF
jgi:hypothetical protein